MSFFSGKSSARNATQQIQTLQRRLDIATLCLEKISEGNFNLTLDQGMQEMQDENNFHFVETLERLKEKLRAYALRDQERLWTAEGISKFMNLIKGDNLGQGDFYDRILSFLIQYLGANQGGIFLLNNQDPADIFLELNACYAYGKKKFLDKRIEIGQGLLGQCFLEKETALFTNIPKNYITITSGLGESTPGFLMMVPIKYNKDVIGIIEVAAFRQLQPFQVEFVEKIAETLASVTLNLRNTQRVDQLLQESEVKAKKLQDQEEDLRQNIETLQITQEDMRRNQLELDRQSRLMKFIIDNIPFPIFVKDEKGRYTVVNKAEARLFNLSDKELIGKDDSSFVSDDDEWKVIRDSDERVLNSETPMELPLQSFTTQNGQRYIFKTTKIPFNNEVTGKKNILGVSIDLTEKLQLEKKLFHEQQISSHNTLINVAGRQRMLSQKIGFYCQTLMRGKTEYAQLLRDAIELHEHSLEIIQFGGIPRGLQPSGSLTAADDTLLPYLENIKNIWAPFKAAALKILSLGSEKHPKPESDKLQAMELCLTFIEENCEHLLKVNDQLMQVCMKINQSKLTEVYQ
jgi:PAS domain S-box-containing protein